MRQRSIYSLALSHAGGTPIMPKLTCSNNPPATKPPPPAPHPHPCRPARLSCYYPVPSICIPWPRALPHFTGIPHWRSQTAVTRQRKGTWSPHSALPSPPSLQPSVKHTHKQSKEEKLFSQCSVLLGSFDWRKNKRLFSLDLWIYMCILRLRLGKHTPIPQVVTVMLIYVFFFSLSLSFFKAFPVTFEPLLLHAQSSYVSPAFQNCSKELYLWVTFSFSILAQF